MCRSKTSLLEATVKRQQHRATCFATLPQNVLTAMMRVLPPTFKPVLQQIKVAASCLNTDVWLDKITREPCTGFTSLAAKQVCLGPVKRATCTDLLQKVELFSSFCKNFWQPATAWFVARRVWVFCSNFAKLFYRTLSSLLLVYSWRYAGHVGWQEQKRPQIWNT